MDLGIALEGFFFEKVNRSTGQRVTFTFPCIIYMRHPHATQLQFAAAKSLIRAKGALLDG